MDDLVSQNMIWSDFFREHEKKPNAPVCCFTSARSEEVSGALRQRLTQARNEFYSLATSLLRRIFPSLPAKDSLSKERRGPQEEDAFILSRPVDLPDTVLTSAGLGLVLDQVAIEKPDWNEFELAYSLHVYARLADGYPLVVTKTTKNSLSKDPIGGEGFLKWIDALLEFVKVGVPCFFSS